VTVVAEISVVIPSKDRLAYLQKSIPMFLSQPEVAQVVVVSDGSTDGTLAYLSELSARDPRVRYADNVRNRGIPYSRNRGLDLADSEYVFAAEDDLELTSDFFKTLLSHMEQSAADIISARNIFRFERETPAEATRRANQFRGKAINRRAITVKTGIPAESDQQQVLLPSPMLARRSVFADVRWDEEYRGNFWREESDLQLSAHERGYRLVFCPHTASFNLMIENDRSGVHASVGLRWLRWVVRNNWRFVNKHRESVQAEFGAGNLYRYITIFAIRQFALDIVWPAIGPILGRVKQSLLCRLAPRLPGCRSRVCEPDAACESQSAVDADC
jgi:glycosyltransferase involved in cell wall biosynthesis